MCWQQSNAGTPVLLNEKQRLCPQPMEDACSPPPADPAGETVPVRFVDEPRKVVLPRMSQGG